VDGVDSLLCAETFAESNDIHNINPQTPPAHSAINIRQFMT
jgi:hypothetical protein